VHRLEHVVRDARADHLQQHRRRHRHPERQHRLVGLLDGVAVLERVHQHARHPRQDAVDDEAGRVATSTPRLRSFFGDVPRRRERLVGRRRRADDLDERHHATG
jgi:hypothetical protein